VRKMVVGGGRSSSLESRSDKKGGRVQETSRNYSALGKRFGRKGRKRGELGRGDGPGEVSVTSLSSSGKKGFLLLEEGVTWDQGRKRSGKEKGALLFLNTRLEKGINIQGRTRDVGKSHVPRGEGMF